MALIRCWFALRGRPRHSGKSAAIPLSPPRPPPHHRPLACRTTPWAIRPGCSNGRRAGGQPWARARPDGLRGRPRPAHLLPYGGADDAEDWLNWGAANGIAPEVLLFILWEASHKMNKLRSISMRFPLSRGSRAPALFPGTLPVKTQGSYSQEVSPLTKWTQFSQWANRS